MNKTLLIFRHEFLYTIRRTGFIILTLSLPLLALLGIGIFRIVSGISSAPAEITKIGYVDQVGGFEQFTTQGNINFINFDTTDAATQALIDKDIKEYFVIPPDFISTGVVNLYSMQKELAPSDTTIGAIDNFLSTNLLAGKVPANIITRVQSPLNYTMTTLTSTGEVAPQQASYVNFIVPAIFSFLLALSLIFSSTYVLQSLSQEKENRLMEILVSSVSTRQLLAGKILGLGAAGLVQVVIWVITLPLLLNLASSSIGGIISTIHVPADFWVLGIIYFILGYLIFSVTSASIASITSTVQEAQGISGIYTLMAVAPFWFISLLMIFPNSPAWIILSIFPYTAPVVTMMRLGVTGVAIWQLALSTAVLALCVAAGLLLAARLLRTYMLMYGKRPNLGQIVRSLRSG